MHLLKELKSKYSGNDIYVIGSGPSLNFIDPNFFENKITLCVNHTINFVAAASSLYLVAKEPSKSMQDAAKTKNANIVTCEYHSGCGPKRNLIYHPEITYIFKPKQNCLYDTQQTESLEYSASTISSAIHLAAFMGAVNIILVAHDCGEIDNNIHVSQYDKATAATPLNLYADWMNLHCIEYNTISMKFELKKQGINVCSLNPFINLGLEGHNYRSFHSKQAT